MSWRGKIKLDYVFDIWGIGTLKIIIALPLHEKSHNIYIYLIFEWSQHSRQLEKYLSIDSSGNCIVSQESG